MMNNYDNMIIKAELENNKTVRPLLIKGAKQEQKANVARLEFCYTLSRLAALPSSVWEDSYYKGFGDAVNQVFGYGESVASRMANVGRVFCEVGDDGKPSYGKYADYCYTALRDLADAFSDVKDLQEKREKIAALIESKGITSKTSSRDIAAFCGKGVKHDGKGKDSKGGKDSADNAGKRDGKGAKNDVIEVVNENDIANFAAIVKDLARLSADNVDGLAKLAALYSKAVGTTMQGTSKKALAKLAGADEVKPQA